MGRTLDIHPLVVLVVSSPAIERHAGAGRRTRRAHRASLPQL